MLILIKAVAGVCAGYPNVGFAIDNERLQPLRPARDKIFTAPRLDWRAILQSSSTISGPNTQHSVRGGFVDAPISSGRGSARLIIQM